MVFKGSQMKLKVVLTVFAVGLLAAMIPENRSARVDAAQKVAPREIAITFDDLIESQSGRHDLKTIAAINRKLVQAITDSHVPAIGFVNEGKLHENNGKEIAARTAILKLWTDAGIELGNHTYSHHDLFTTPLELFQADLIRGEAVTSRLLDASGMKLRYFRHPFLHTGPDAETKTAFEKFLVGRNYTIAPVSVDNQDWMFAAVYTTALADNDRALMKRVAEAYLPYMNAMLEHYEKLSVTLLGYEVRQTLLIHDNPLNADHFGELVEVMKKRGYKFISLEEALQDKAYSLPDNYTGRSGISWLERWAMTQKHQAAIDSFKLEPEVPDFIKQKMSRSL